MTIKSVIYVVAITLGVIELSQPGTLEHVASDIGESINVVKTYITDMVNTNA